MTAPGPTPGMGIVFGLVLLAAILFGMARVPNDMAAIGLAVGLAVLGRWTGITPEEAVSGFASPAVVTVLSMFILSEGVRRSGVIERVGRRLARFTRRGPRHELGITLGLAGPAAGFVNNTPLVAVLVPLVVELARRDRTSPSRLLMPLSFIAMMGGTLTVIGTSTNILASDLSGRLLGRPIGLFELTPLGLIVLGVGAAYLMTVGRRLLPDRVEPEADLTERFRMRDCLFRGRVSPASPLVGRTIRESQAGTALDLDILRIERGERVFLGPTSDQSIAVGDVLTVRSAPDDLEAFAARGKIELFGDAEVTDASLVDADHTLVEATVRPDSRLAGETLVSSDFRHRYGATVMAIGREDRTIRERIEGVELREGDALLALASRDRVRGLEEAPGLELTRTSPLDPSPLEESESSDGPTGPRSGRAITAVGIVGLVVAAAAVDWLPIYLSALAGVVLMVATGCLRPSQAYQSVSWNVVFLLAGIIPLGLALDRTGAGAFLARIVVEWAGDLPAVAVLGAFYLLTSLLASVITNSVAVVFMLPVAVDAAGQIGANPFAFVLAVLFAAATAFMTPVGYQTNLMVLGPGGYRYGDFVRVGAPLQALLAVTTTAGIALLWGV